jgi:hypothetical protein
VPTPPAGHVALYSADGSALLIENEAGTVTTLGAGGGGGSRISELTAITTPVGADELPVNDGGVTKKITLSQVDAYVGPFRRSATASQALGTGDTYVTESRLVLPQTRMQAGVVYRARCVITKTGAGTATPTFTLRTGTAGTTGDTSRLAYTGVAQTAVVDTAFLEFQATFRVVGASAVLASWLRFTHDLATTGFANANRTFQGQAVSAAFDSTTSSMGIGFSINAGASSAWTVQQCYAELVNLAN